MTVIVTSTSGLESLQPAAPEGLPAGEAAPRGTPADQKVPTTSVLPYVLVFIAVVVGAAILKWRRAKFAPSTASPAAVPKADLVPRMGASFAAVFAGLVLARYVLLNQEDLKVWHWTWWYVERLADTATFWKILAVVTISAVAGWMVSPRLMGR